MIRQPGGSPPGLAAMPDIPPDFQPLNSTSPFNNLVGPYFAALRDDHIVMGLRLEEKHCNKSGRLHGAMVCAIFDVTLGHNIGLHVARADGQALTELATPIPMVTVSLTTDYMGTASIGDWIEGSASVQRAGTSMAFASAELRHGDEIIAKANGVYRIFS